MAKKNEDVEPFSPEERDAIIGIVGDLLGTVPDTSAATVPDTSALNLYTLKFRRGARGVETGYLRATSLDKALEVGRAWCSSIPGCQFITVTSAILADESILGDSGSEIRRKLAGVAG